MLRYVQNDRVLVCSHRLENLAIGMRCELRGKSISITKFTKYRWNDVVFEGTEEHLDVLGSALFFLLLWILIFFKRKDFFILIMFLREQSWRNSFALKRWGNWCDDVVMWWCGYVVMRWKSRIRNLRHWVLCKTTAPIDNATLTDTIFFSPTLKGGKLFIVSCEFWFFLYAKIFLYPLCF